MDSCHKKETQMLTKWIWIMCFQMKSSVVTDWMVLLCDHLICLNCFIKYIEQQKPKKRERLPKYGRRKPHDYSTTANCGSLGLKCYSCRSTMSWDDCEATSKECLLPGADRCAKVYFKAASSKIFAKYCTLSALCSKDDIPTCKGQFGSFECEVNCCDGDNCNAGSTSRISSILLLTCALASLMILVKV